MVDSERDDWWERFATATVQDNCLPCPECNHTHTCWWCKTLERVTGPACNGDQKPSMSNKINNRSPLTPALKDLLEVLEEVGTATSSQLANVSGKSKEVVREYLTILYHQGWVSREPSPSSKRVFIYRSERDNNDS